MAVDWDNEAFAAVHEAFGEPVRYMPAAGLPFDIPDAIFEKQHRTVTILDDGSSFTTQQPMVAVRLSYFPEGMVPQQDDRLFVESVKTLYVVSDPQLDNHGVAKLMLQKSGGAP